MQYPVHYKAVQYNTHTSHSSVITKGLSQHSSETHIEYYTYKVHKLLPSQFLLQVYNIHKYPVTGSFCYFNLFCTVNVKNRCFSTH